MNVSKVFMVMVLCLGLGLFQIAAAQGNMKAGIEGNLALPTGDFGDAAGTGFGGTAMFLYEYSPEIAITAHAGYLSFGGESNEVYDFSYSAIPILAGARYYIEMQGTARPYVGAQLGFHFFSFDATYKGDNFGGFFSGGDYSDSETKFSFAPTVGAEFDAIDVSAFYMIISDASYIGFRVGYGFPIGQ